MNSAIFTPAETFTVYSRPAADNVAEAIRAVRPFGVDLCSGVRTEGRLDGGKLATFFEAVRAAA